MKLYLCWIGIVSQSFSSRDINFDVGFYDAGNAKDETNSKESVFNKTKAPLDEPISIYDIIDTNEEKIQPHMEEGAEELDKVLSPSTSLPIGKHHFILFLISLMLY